MGVIRRVVGQCGITRRIVEQCGITRRIVGQCGITRRIVRQCGITRRIVGPVFRIRISFHADPDPGSKNCPYGSGSKEVNTKEE